MTNIVTATLANGLLVAIETVPSVSSVAVNWLLPIGSATDPADGDGFAAMLSDFALRGAGLRDSREHSDALDRLGVNKGCDVQTHHLRLEATLLGNRLADALPLLTDVITAPLMQAEHLAAVRSLCLQSLEGLDDDPQTLAMLRLRERHLPPPFNRTGYGEPAVFEHATIDGLRQSWSARCKPGGSILGIAGAVDADAVLAQLDSLLLDWQGQAPPPTKHGEAPRGYLPIEQTTAQMHIGVAWDGPREADPASMIERVAISVLSGSTSGRLFTEVRQKRSLCYSVGASYRAGKDSGVVTLYAGTTPERAQETLEVCLAEIDRLREGVRDDEFKRAVVGLKSQQVMQGESTPSRAAALVYDLFRIGRARTLEEVAAQIDAVTLDQVNAHVAARDLGRTTIVTIGPTPLACK